MIVHALLRGFPLCGFSNDFPKNWPEGNIWTPVDDIENINCETCKEKALLLNTPFTPERSFDPEEYKRTLGGRDL